MSTTYGRTVNTGPVVAGGAGTARVVRRRAGRPHYRMRRYGMEALAVAFGVVIAIEFVKTPEFIEKIQSFVNGYNYIDNIKNYNKELLSIKDNRCIIKTNIKSSISKVHIGNNKWETKDDGDIFPKMVCSLADDMCNAILQFKTADRYKILQRILDCMADNGYVNDNKEIKKEMLDNFKNIVKDLKLVVYDLSKESE